MSADEIARSVYAKGFPKSAVLTENSVKSIFEVFGRVRSVKLRKDDKTGTFRGSVYIEFDKESAAMRAVGDPPLQPGARERLSVMLRSEYERRALEASGKDGSAKKNSGGGVIMNPAKRAKIEVGGAADTFAAVVTSSGGKSIAYWQHAAEEREKRVKELEESLKTEKDHAHKAQEGMDEALKREQVAGRKLLSKETDVGRLKGEVTSLRATMHAKLDALTQTHNARVHELEARVEAQKSEIFLLKKAAKEREREAKGVSVTVPTNPIAPTSPAQLEDEDDM